MGEGSIGEGEGYDGGQVSAECMECGGGVEMEDNGSVGACILFLLCMF